MVGGGRAEAERARPSETDAALGAPAPLGILLVEDNAVNRQLALLLLEKLGHRADLAVTGVQALEALRRQPYDVVLMDVEMPEMDGLEATRRIHHEWRGKQRPRIVAMTANAMEGDRERCLAAGMDDYVSKPIGQHELAEALRRCRPRAVGVPEPPRVAAPHDSRVLDPEALEQLRSRAGDRTFVLDIVDAFLADAPALLDRLRAALPGAEAAPLRRAAHTLKSNARVFGAMRLAELSRALEARAKAGDVAGAADLVPQIELEYAAVADALRAAQRELT